MADSMIVPMNTEGVSVNPAASAASILQLEEELDQDVFLKLRDERDLVGVMRSFDHFGNILLEHTAHRISVYDKERRCMLYSDIPLGVIIIRGENVILMGRLREPRYGDKKDTGLGDVVCDIRFIESPLDEILNLKDTRSDTWSHQECIIDD